MAEENNPSTAEHVTAAASHAPEANGRPAPPSPDASHAPGSHWVGWIRLEAVRLGVAAALALGVLGVLLLFGISRLVAGTIGVLALVVARVIAHHLIPDPQPKLKTATAAEPQAPVQQPDSIREIIETVVFVVVLVLMLRSFAAEAFVIPTGSMATTLWGYQKVVTCPECGYEFPVNCSQEVDPQSPPPIFVDGGTCPNCEKKIHFNQPGHPGGPRNLNEDAIPDPGWNSGDRVLVAKFIYDLFKALPSRLDVVVFKYPKEPVKSHVPMNYIKRLVGLPGETIAIHYGKLYVLPADKSKTYDDTKEAETDPEKRVNLWRDEHMHQDDARDQFRDGLFEIVRKSPETILAMRRIVYDNDHPAKDLKDTPPRWWSKDEDVWRADGTAFRAGTAGADQPAWLRYRHLRRDRGDKPTLITDFMGYNTWLPHTPPGENWVGDLMLECEVTLDKSQGELMLELSKGVDRFRARWDLATGDCTLSRLPNFKARLGAINEEQKLGTKPTALKKPGTYRVRFADIDQKLTVWVGNDLPFGEEGVSFEAPKAKGPTDNDLEPAGIGVRGTSLTVRKMTLWRDTYYTLSPGAADVTVHDGDLSDPSKWDALQDLPVRTLYVQPGHFLCLGDNSPESSDGRSWGLVPERLMLGKALLVYYPFNRAGRIR
jgi:signal peptidase I